jgi:hypothetical protein
MEIDPYLASFNEIADFLAFLFDEGLHYRKMQMNVISVAFISY